MRVSSITLHPDYDTETLDNDIAILYLSEAVPDYVSLPNVTLDDGTFTAIGSDLIVSGWGAIDADAEVYPTKLQVRAVLCRFLTKCVQCVQYANRCFVQFTGA